MENGPFSKEKNLLSVVIATLGGDSLEKTIDHLNVGAIKPFEILICIPTEDACRVNDFFFKNVRVIKTSCRGQVAQRAIGFQKARGRYVLQLDDDMLVTKTCVEYLLNTAIAEGGNVAIAPALICDSSRKSFYQRPRNQLLLWVYYWLLNGSSGYQPGKITLAGTNVGIDPRFVEDDVVEVEWVPGGCLLHRRDNLITDNFYPFSGKAYSEDLYHSYFLKLNQVKLMVCNSAECFLDDSVVVYNFTVLDFLSYLKADLKARSHLVKLTKNSLTRMYVYYVFTILRYISIKIKGCLGSG